MNFLSKQLEMPAALKDVFKATQPNVSVFEQVMALRGKVFRDVAGRKTMQLSLAGQSYFVKLHFGVGWPEIFKNLVSLKKPILGAMTEVKAIQKLTQIGIPTTPLVAYGAQGCSPASMRSFVITEDLGAIVSLEDLCAEWKVKPPTLRFKRKLINAVAALASRLHANAVNHRDFYICHLCLDRQLLESGEIKLYLIDLHRALIHPSPHTKLNMKDIAALYFSSMDLGLTVRDFLRFKHYYLAQTQGFWQQTETRAAKLYAKFNSDKFQKRLAAEKSSVD